MEPFEEKGLEHLERIEEELEEIRTRTSNPRRSFLIGILQGAGAIIGGILALALVGWLLSILGIIPGFGHLADYLRSLVDNLPTR